MPCNFSTRNIANPGEPSSSNACTMLQTLSEDNKRKKFEIAYFFTNSKLVYSKYAAICKLKTCHELDIGTPYVNKNASKTFCKYIAEARIIDLHKTVTDAKFF